METPADLGEPTAFDELLRDVDVQRIEFADVRYIEQFYLVDAREWGAAVTTAGRLARFYKAVAEGDRAGADSVLRMWGIRR